MNIEKIIKLDLKQKGSLKALAEALRLINEPKERTPDFRRYFNKRD